MAETRFNDFFESRIKENRSKLLFQKRDGWSWKQITWLDFETEVKSIASFLYDQGFRKDDKVIIISPNTLECLFSESAIFLLGGCTIPLSQHIKAGELKKIISENKAKYIFLRNEGLLNNFREIIESDDSLEKVFIFSDYKSDIEDKIINYRTLIKFGFLKRKKLSDELKKYMETVEPTSPAIIFYGTEDHEPTGRVLSQQLLLELLNLTYKKIRFITPEDQAFSYLTSTGSFAKLVNFLTVQIGTRGAIAENKRDFFSDALEVMPTVMFLTQEGMQRSVEYLSKVNGSRSLKKCLGGRVKYIFTDSDPDFSVKNRFISDGISVIHLPELATLSS